MLYLFCLWPTLLHISVALFNTRSSLWEIILAPSLTEGPGAEVARWRIIMRPYFGIIYALIHRKKPSHPFPQTHPTLSQKTYWSSLQHLKVQQLTIHNNHHNRITWRALLYIALLCLCVKHKYIPESFSQSWGLLFLAKVRRGEQNSLIQKRKFGTVWVSGHINGHPQAQHSC